MRIDEMSSPEFAARVKDNPWVIIPLGAVEAHGRHLPLGTDSIQPQWVAERLAERTGSLLAPLLPYGNHSSTRRMPGTINLRFDTLRALVLDILESLHEQGLRRFLIVSGHAGGAHMTALKEASKELLEERDATVIVLTDYSVAAEIAPSLGIGHGDGHGGALETARVMAIRPDLVGEDMVAGEFVSPGYRIYADPERCFPEGIAGDPSVADAAMGERLNMHVVESLERMMEESVDG